jgi:hypothetical protein
LRFSQRRRKTDLAIKAGPAHDGFIGISPYSGRTRTDHRHRIGFQTQGVPRHNGIEPTIHLDGEANSAGLYYASRADELLPPAWTVCSVPARDNGSQTKYRSDRLRTSGGIAKLKRIFSNALPTEYREVVRLLSCCFAGVLFIAFACFSGRPFLRPLWACPNGTKLVLIKRALQVLICLLTTTY